MGSSVIPPLPPGFVLDGGTPPLPPGFVLDDEKKKPKADSGPKPTGGESFWTGIKSPVAGALQLALDSPLSMPFVNPVLAKGLSESITESEKDYQARRGEDAKNTDWMRIAGEVSNPATLVSPAKAATTLGRVGQSSAIAGLFGLARPGATGEERIADAAKGAVVGALLPGGWELAKLLGRGGRNLFQGVFSPEAAAGRISREVSGKKVDDVIEALSKAEKGQTAQQAAVPAGSAKFAALTEIAAKKQPDEYLGIQKAQEAARSNALKEAGGTAEAVAMAKGDRAMAAAQLYGDALSTAVKADPELAKIASNPYYKDALPEALKVMESRTGGVGKPNLTELLQVVKEALDQKIGAFGDTALNKAAKREAVKVQDQLITWLEKKNPEFAKAQAQYAKDSIPVNQGQVLEYLEGVTRNPLGVKEMPGTFGNAVKKAPSTIEKATGREYSDLSEVLNPKQMDVVNSLIKQYQTDALAKQQAGAGLDATARQIGDLSHIQGTGMLNRYVTLATSGMRKVASGSTDKAIEAIATLGRNPDKFAEVMRKAKPYERQEIVDLLMQQQARALGITAAQD